MFTDYINGPRCEFSVVHDDSANIGINESNIKLLVVNACWNTLDGFITLEQLNAVAYGGEQTKRKKKIIHVNQHEIKKNRKNGTINPVLTCKFGSKAKRADGTNVYAHEAIIRDDNGREVAKVVYRPNKPLSCGAHVWIETYMDVQTIVRQKEVEQ